MKRIPQNLLLFISSILLAFLIAELCMRLFGAIYNIDFTLYMQELKNSNRLPQALLLRNKDSYGLNPNTQVLATTSDFSVIYKTNSQGLRDKEHTFQKSAQIKRVLILGDSLTFGEGIEYGDRFTDIAQRHLQNLEIINAGIPGFSLNQMLLKFTQEGLNYSPDMVVIFINTNVLYRKDNYGIENNSVELNDLSPKQPQNTAMTLYFSKNDPFFNKENFNIVNHSYLFSFLSYQISIRMLMNKLEMNDQRAWARIQQTRKNNRSSSYDLIISRATPLFSKFLEICMQRGIKLIVVNISSHPQKMDFIKNISDKILYYDLSDYLFSESRKQNLCFIYDRHFNKKANSLIAEKLINILQENSNP
ncbi:MAG: SGNH/GDSL hydrolase family protein [Candidatus Omnitrophica bacterium]|nr:SGNH/GDSL hydrolase family protein [Candidatus Omnitrophota bacterium]